MKLLRAPRTVWRSPGVPPLVFGATALLAGCAGSPPSASEPPSAGGPPAAPTVEARLADGRPISAWAAGEPVPCRTVDDCQFVAPSDLRCPGCCGFCGGGEVAPRGLVPVACSRPPPHVCDRVSCAACGPPGPPRRLVCGAPEAGSSLGTCLAEVDAAKSAAPR